MDGTLLNARLNAEVRNRIVEESGDGGRRKRSEGTLCKSCPLWHSAVIELARGEGCSIGTPADGCSLAFCIEKSTAKSDEVASRKLVSGPMNILQLISY